MKYFFITILLVLSAFAFNNFFLNPDNETQSRIPANKNLDQRISDSLKKLKEIDSFENANTILENVSLELKSFESDQADALANAISIIKESEGILPALEPVLSQSAMLSTGVIAKLKALKQSIPIDVAYLHILIDRLFVTNRDDKKYKSLTEVQNSLLTSGGAIERLILLDKKLSKSLEKFSPSVAPTHLFNIDLRAMAGPAKNLLPQDVSHFSVLSTHLFISKALIQSLIANLYYFTSYDLDRYAELNSKSMRKTAQKVAGLKYTVAYKNGLKLSPIQYHKMLNRNDYVKVLTLHKQKGSSHTLAKSKQWLIKSFNAESEAIVAAKQVSKYEQKVKVSDALIEQYSKKSQSAVELAKIVLESNKAYTLTNPMNGAMFKVNPSEIFNLQNKNIQNLKSLFPSSHDTRLYKTVAEHRILNLNYGASTAWSDPTFAGVLPDAKSAKDVQRQMKALAIIPGFDSLVAWLALFQ